MPSLTGPVLPPGTLAALRQPTLIAGELVLRPWLAGDVPTVVAAYADPAIRQWHVRSMSEPEASQWIEQWPAHWSAETGASWAIVVDQRVIGQIGLRQLSLSEALAAVSYWVVPVARGYRVAPRALQALTAWALEKVRLHRLELSHSSANLASCQVAESAGYVLEGTKRAEGLHADGWHDMHLHARLATDLPTLREPDSEC
jgi:RimJ/RimL family protein N-acetyltransferase